MYEIMARYRNTFGGLGIYAVGGYVGSGHVNSPLAGVSAVLPNATNFSVGDGGLALTYAGFTVGGHVIFGQLNGQVGLKPQGAPNAVAFIAGMQYANGPLTVGASWFNYQSQGAVALTGLSQRYDEGLDIGGTYAIAPGLLAYVGYSYGQRHQGGVDFISGAVGPLNNTVHVQNFLIGTRVAW
jgi:predicted porin